MRRQLVVPLLAGILAGTLLAPAPAFPAGNSVLTQLYAVPQHGHSGDWIYLSGSGFAPGKPLVLTMACPSDYDPAAYEHHNYSIFAGPTPDAHGEFMNFKFKAIPLHDFPFSNCQIYSTFGDYSFAVPASYTILSPNSPLGRCDKVICAKVAVSPKHVRPGSVEHIDITNSWPGAQAVVNVKYSLPNVRAQRQTGTLDFEGRASLRFRVSAPPGPRPVKAHIQLSFSLEDRKGAETADFVVIH